MSLYLVGENIEKAQAHYRSERGDLVQLMRGIYVDASDHVDETVLAHAVRIAKYLYPRAYLASASSALLHPTDSGKLYISGPRNNRIRIRALEIIQNRTSENPSIVTTTIEDPTGTFTMAASSIRQRFLESFRMRSEHAAAIGDTMQRTLAERLLEEYGTPSKAADATWSLARNNDWLKEGEKADRYLHHGLNIKQVTNRTVLKFIVAWHQETIGALSHDGFEWRWTAEDAFTLPLVRQTIPGKLPPFISSLLPEGWLQKILNSENERSTLRNGKRYMSNITIIEQGEKPDALPIDILHTPLNTFTQSGIFIGGYKGPRRSTLEESFEQNLAQLYKQSDIPRLSGVQIKAPMYLASDGSLMPSTGKPFTHILKPAGTGGFEALPLVEWVSLTLGQLAGFNVPDFALIPMPDNMIPALLIERFDIRTSQNDARRMAMEDFCSLLDLTPEEKYQGTIEKAGRALRSISTTPEVDLLTLFKRALFAWLIADGDMHLKNLSILKIAMPGENLFRNIEMAPLYDAVTTVVFPGLAHDRMAMKLNGKDSKLKKKDFLRTATALGLKSADTESAIEQIISDLTQAIATVSLPSGLTYAPAILGAVANQLDVCRERTAAFRL